MSRGTPALSHLRRTEPAQRDGAEPGDDVAFDGAGSRRRGWFGEGAVGDPFDEDHVGPVLRPVADVTGCEQVQLVGAVLCDPGPGTCDSERLLLGVSVAVGPASGPARPPWTGGIRRGRLGCDETTPRSPAGQLVERAAEVDPLRRRQPRRWATVGAEDRVVSAPQEPAEGFGAADGLVLAGGGRPAVPAGVADEGGVRGEAHQRPPDGLSSRAGRVAVTVAAGRAGVVQACGVATESGPNGCADVLVTTVGPAGIEPATKRL